MKNKIIYTILLISIIFYSFSINKIQKKHLPVCVVLRATFSDSVLLQFYFKAAFKKYKIETLSKKTSEEITDMETRRVLYDYFSTAQSPTNEEAQNFLAKNSTYQVNKLFIKLTIDSSSNTFNTFEWSNIAVPMAINRDVQKGSPSKINLDNIKHMPLSEMVQAITDSIVASGKLYKE